MAAVPVELTDCVLCGAADAAHERALSAVADLSARPLDAVFWLATHLAATARVIHPAVRAALPEGRRLVAAQGRIDHRLEQSLWVLDRRLTGDTHVYDLAASRVVSRLRADLLAHAEHEHRLLGLLESATSVAVQRNLAERLDRWTARAPTRPHPLTRHLPGVGGALFRLDAMSDHVRDVLDNRHVPLQRRRDARSRPGRWGLYALGTSAPDAADRE